MSDFTFWGYVTAFGYLLTFLLIPWVVLTKKRHPVSTIAWVMAIVLLPIFGSFLFLVFGINRVHRRTARKKRANSRIASLLPGLSRYQVIASESLTPQQQRLARVANETSGSIVTYGNRVEVIPDTHRTLELIEEAIGAAKKTLHLEYYIWQPDETGTKVRDLLIQKAQEGVAVRFVYDQLGSMWLNRKFLQPMREAGIRVAPFLQGASLRERWSVNLRNHRKILVVDGQVAFTGGMNIGDEYLGLHPVLGYWRDTHLKLTGPVVLQLQHIFAEDWFYATGEELIQDDLYPAPKESGKVRAQVISGGPDNAAEVFHALMFAAINEAKERVTLATSYFVPLPSLVTALESASYRGVKVRCMISGRSAHPMTVLAARSYYDSLLNAGVEIYEFKKGLLHAKTLTVDGSWSLVGSPNFDARSLILNFEAGVAMYDGKLATELEEQFAADMNDSQRIDRDRWNERAISQIVTENICRLFAPVL